MAYTMHRDFSRDLSLWEVLSNSAHRLYNAIECHFKEREWTFTLNPEQWCDRCRFSRRAFFRAKKELVDKGAIVEVPGGYIYLKNFSVTGANSVTPSANSVTPSSANLDTPECQPCHSSVPTLTLNSANLGTPKSLDANGVNGSSDPPSLLSTFFPPSSSTNFGGGGGGGEIFPGEEPGEEQADHSPAPLPDLRESLAAIAGSLDGVDLPGGELEPETTSTTSMIGKGADLASEVFQDDAIPSVGASSMRGRDYVGEMADLYGCDRDMAIDLLDYWSTKAGPDVNNLLGWAVWRCKQSPQSCMREYLSGGETGGAVAKSAPNPGNIAAGFGGGRMDGWELWEQQEDDVADLITEVQILSRELGYPAPDMSRWSRADFELRINMWRRDAELLKAPGPALAVVRQAVAGVA